MFRSCLSVSCPNKENSSLFRNRCNDRCRLGTKSDLRGLNHAVQAHEGEEVKRTLNGNAFLECSAKEYRNINEVIYEAVRAADRGVPPPQEEEEGCMSFLTCCF